MGSVAELRRDHHLGIPRYLIVGPGDKTILASAMDKHQARCERDRRIDARIIRNPYRRIGPSRAERRHLDVPERWFEFYQPSEHARALDAMAVAVENVAASELGGGA